jgi:predicted permease
MRWRRAWRIGKRTQLWQVYPINMWNIGQNFRYTIRQLVKSPGFTIVSILTIALGIGANTAVFSVMNAVLLRFLPVPNPQELVYFHLKNQPLNTSQAGYDDTSMPLPVFEAIRSRQEVFTDVMAFVPLAFQKVSVRVGPEPEQAFGEMVSGNFFSGLGVEPVLGRGFTLEDELNHAPVAVLSYQWWRQRFGGSHNVLDQTVYVKGVAFTVIGVAPSGFGGTDPGHPNMDFWVPLQSSPVLNAWGSPASEHTLYGSPNWLCLLMVGRLRPGLSAQQASAQLTPLFRRTLAQASPVDPNDLKPELMFSNVRGVGGLRDDYEQPLHFLMAMVGLVLLIAVGNVALLLVVRNAARQREFALRRALGANARVLFAQLLSESLMLVVGGSALGWIFAVWTTEALAGWAQLDAMVAPDRQVLLFTLAISAVVALVFGLVPMRAAGNVPLVQSLKSSAGTSNADRHRSWGRKLVVTMQIAFCVVLLFSGTLLYETLRNLESRDLGMRTAGLVVFGITPQSTVRTDAEAIRFHLALLERLRALPGVDSATISENRLGSGLSSNDGVLVDGRNPLPAKPFAPMRVNLVGSAFLRTLGISLRMGRDFEEGDIANSRKIAIINQTFADRYLPHANPLGHQISYFESPKTGYTIVGVAQNSRYTSVKETDRPIAYIPFTQDPSGLMQYELHTSGDARGILAEAAKIVRGIDPNLPLEKPITQWEQFDETISQERLIAILSAFFAGLAAFLVAVGLYGTISYSVSRRTMEIGLRTALGAQRKEVLGMVLRESLFLAALGLGIGAPMAFAVGRALHSMLFGLSSANLTACLLALAGVAMIVAVATFFPARRAASIDPIRALRME